ncbi:hypothetical protein VMCG_06893 [Cytospora schulzeri]|uniref:Uncharacterized protein n=1 Tax=Cytospora schulzeri TaxID=448051 RepID=A0A423W1W4_9PEZI|nr:hypothetical protein VMCG_06893 [Valsa malicola]
MPSSGSDHGHKKRRPSFWGCRPSGTRSTGRSRDSKESKVQRSDDPSSQTNSPSSQRHRSDRKKKVSIDIDPENGFWSDSTHPENMDYDDYPARSPRLIMRPFCQLVSLVKHCPWMLGSDVHPFAASSGADDIFFPPVPRSLLHDTAVSFVVTDHTRLEQPQFVISCPLENVELVQRLLAPDGSHRQLSARGSSRQPRNADQLRSMLLDGTPNIELSLHWAPGSGWSSSSSTVGRSGPGGGHPFGFGPGVGLEFQGNLFPRRLESYRDGVAGQQGRPSEAESNGGADSPAGGSGGGNDGSGSGANGHLQNGWGASGTGLGINAKRRYYSGRDYQEL